MEMQSILKIEVKEKDIGEYKEKRERNRKT